MVKLVFFLFFISGVSLLGLLILCLVAILRPTKSSEAGVYSAAYTSLKSALLFTLVVFLIYFKPIQKRLHHWLCCCMLKKRIVKHTNKLNTVKGRSTHGQEKTMKEVQIPRQ